MTQAAQHAIAVAWGVLMLLLVLGGIGWRLKARVQARMPRPKRRLPRRWGSTSGGQLAAVSGMRPHLMTRLILNAVAVALAGCSSTRLGAKPNKADWPQTQISIDANRHQTCEAAHKRDCK
jgi:hypothetical protein